MKGKGFAEIYADACYRCGTCPQKCVKNLGEGILTIRTDRIKTDDWRPLLQTLEKYETIKYLAVRNKSETKTTTTDAKEISNKLNHVLKHLLQHGKTFQCLILEKIHFSEQNVNILSQGLSNNSSLRYISFEKCRLGNKNCQIICQSIKNSSSLSAVDFSDCNLTWKIGNVLANFIEQQNVVRRANIWQNSLRYQICHLERMGGLGEINLSNNSAFGDRGFSVLAKGLAEDSCLSELYLRHCGLTDDSAAIFEKLSVNKIALGLDVDDNSFQDEMLYEKIYDKFGPKPSLEKLQRRFMPQIVVQVDEKSNFPPFKTGLPNRKTETVKIKTKTTTVSHEFDRDLKEELTRCSDQLERERSQHLQTKQTLHKIMSETSEKGEFKLDDSVLTAIEGTFKKFQDFITLLKTSELENFVKVPSFPTHFQAGDSNQSGRGWVSLSKRVSEESSNKYHFQTYFKFFIFFFYLNI